MEVKGGGVMVRMGVLAGYEAVKTASTFVLGALGPTACHSAFKRSAADELLSLVRTRACIHAHNTHTHTKKKGTHLLPPPEHVQGGGQGVCKMRLAQVRPPVTILWGGRPVRKDSERCVVLVGELPGEEGGTRSKTVRGQWRHAMELASGLLML